MQPLTAGITNAQAAPNWLRAEPPELDEVQRALGRVVEAGNRTTDIMNRIRALFKKTPPRKEPVDVNEAILEVVTLTHGEAVKNGVSVETRLGDDVPHQDGEERFGRCPRRGAGFRAGTEIGGLRSRLRCVLHDES